MKTLVRDFHRVTDKADTPAPIGLLVEAMHNREYVLANLSIRLTRADDVLPIAPVQRDSVLGHGIVDRLTISVMTDGDVITATISADMLNALDITIADAWDQAIANVTKSATVRSIADVLSEISGIPRFLLEDFKVPMYVVGYDTPTKFGASAIYSPHVKAELKEIFGTDEAIILPSSVHEVIAIPPHFDIDAMSDMVAMVNDGEVDAREQLSDEAIPYHL